MAKPVQKIFHIESRTLGLRPNKNIQTFYVHPNYLKLNHEFARAKTSEYLIKEMDVWNGK